MMEFPTASATPWDIVAEEGRSLSGVRRQFRLALWRLIALPCAWLPPGFPVLQCGLEFAPRLFVLDRRTRGLPRKNL